jgi:hypothetical protein
MFGAHLVSLVDWYAASVIGHMYVGSPAEGGVMGEWDWDNITTGEWWVVLIALAMLAVGTAIGYAMGQKKAHEEMHQGVGATTAQRPLP